MLQWQFHSFMPHYISVAQNNYLIFFLINDSYQFERHGSYYWFSGPYLLQLMLWPNNEREVCSSFLHLCCLSTMTITQQIYCIIKALGSLKWQGVQDKQSPHYGFAFSRFVLSLLLLFNHHSHQALFAYWDNS